MNEAIPVVLLGVVVTERHPDRGILTRHLIPSSRDESVLVEESHAPRGRFIAIVIMERSRPSRSSPIIPMLYQFGLT